MDCQVVPGVAVNAQPHSGSPALIVKPRNLESDQKWGSLPGKAAIGKSVSVMFRLIRIGGGADYHSTLART
jgi:hypothetical protein